MYICDPHMIDHIKSIVQFPHECLLFWIPLDEDIALPILGVQLTAKLKNALKQSLQGQLFSIEAFLQ